MGGDRGPVGTQPLLHPGCHLSSVAQGPHPACPVSHVRWLVSLQVGQQTLAC